MRERYSLPTPLPAQTTSQYADSDTHQIGLGTTYAFPNGLSTESTACVSVSVRVALEPRRMDKQDEMNGVDLQ